MSEFFEIFSIPEGQSTHKFEWKPEQLDLKYEGCNFSKPLGMELTCFRRGLNITCTGMISTKVEMRCVCCLEMFMHNISEPLDFTARLILGAPIIQSLWENDNVCVDQFAGKIDLTERVRDAVILGIPTHPMCSKDCKGLCPVCGANLNKVDCGHANEQSADPRWNKLKELLENKSGTDRKNK